MADKKGKKGKGGKKAKDDPNKLAAVDRTFFELTITDLNQKLSRLRGQVATLDDANFELKEKLRSLEEDRADVASHLDRTLAERNDTITELEERLEELTKVRNKEKQEADEQIKDLETKYKSMHDQLTSEIKLLNGKLNSLDEFRVQRDMLLAKFDDLEDELKEKDRAQQEAIYNMEQKAVVEKDALKKEVEAKLLQVSEDFTRSSEIRNAGYTRRLIRENIALQKEIDTLVLSQIKMQQDFNDFVAQNKEMSDHYNALDQLKNQLIRSSQNKIQIIEKLTDNYERLKTKYTEVVKYRGLYENLAKREVCDRFAFTENSKKLRILGQQIESLKMEKHHLMAMHEQHEAEIMRVRGIIQQIKSTVETAISVGKEDLKPTAMVGGAETEADADAQGMKQLRRQNLLSQLLEIISSQSDRLPDTPSIETMTPSLTSLYRPGKMGFLPRPPSSLMEIFKREAQKLSSSDGVQQEYQAEETITQIVPKSRAQEAGSLIDVEMGSLLVVSSSREEMEIVQVEEEPEDVGEEGESSSEYEAPADAETAADTAPETVPEKIPSVLPPEGDGGGGDTHKSVDVGRSVAEGLDDGSEVLETRESRQESMSRSSRASRMSKQKSLPDIETEEYTINLPATY